MAKVFTNKTSYSLLKTNPKLTGNIKMVVDSKGDIFIETIDAKPELTRNKYKRVKLDLENNWSSSIYNFFNKGSIPKSILYSLKDNEDFYSIKTDFSKQYYTDYQQGTKPKISKLYDEQISYFAPLWLEPNDIPEYFAIFKIPEPVSVSTKTQTNPFDGDVEKQIYNTNYFDTFPDSGGATASDYFFKTVLSKAKLHKVFNMGLDSTLGKYLRNHINDVEMPESSLTIDWNINSNSTVNGISLEKSGFAKESLDIFSEAFPVDRTVTEFDNFITNQFENKGIVHPNIINLEFLFDDEDDPDFTINRYFGVYFNRNDISKFNLDSKAFYNKKYDNIKQNRYIDSVYSVDVLSDTNIVLENEKGIKLFVDYGDEYKVKSSDIKGSNFLPYIYSTDQIFYDLENNYDWQDDELILKDKTINTRDFKGFTKESVGIIPSTKTNKSGRSYFEFKVKGNIASFELRIKDVEEYKSDFNKKQVFIGDTLLDKGTFIGNKFSLKGTPDEVANAIVSAINSYSDSDEDFNIDAITKFDKVVVFTRGINEYWNKYKYLIYSEDINIANSIEVPYKTFGNLTDFNTKRAKPGAKGATAPAFLDYDNIVNNTAIGSTNFNSGFSILESNFTNGNNESRNKIRVPIELTDYFNTSLFLKTQTWYSKVVSIDAYLDEPVFKGGKIVDFTNFDSYKTINCSDDVWVSPGAYSQLYEIETNKVGLMSMYPIKQFDVDQFRSEYGKDGDGDIIELTKNYIDKRGPTGTYDPSAPYTPATNKFSISFQIQNFRDTGFKRLAGKIDETTNDILSTTNEYDRLSENELPELSIKGKIIPYINKWVYDDDGKDVRENNYRMTSNSAFSYDNFSPSSKNTLPDFRFFTHEWYYLQKYPHYLTTEEKINSFSYFENLIEKGSYASGATSNLGIKDITEDKFLEYFTEYKVGATGGDYYFPAKRKYSIISGGNEDSFGETFFRGSKIKFKRRIENEIKLNSNIENIGVFKSDEFNGYKFSAILTNNTDNALNYSIIENKKYKTITMIIEAKLQDYFLNYDASGATGATALLLDRSSLYVLEDKFSSAPPNDYDDIEISGAITPFLETPISTTYPAGYIANFKRTGTPGEYIYTIKGNQNTNGSLPDFKNQIVPISTGQYSDITIDLGFGQFINIKEIIAVTEDTITAKVFNFNSTPLNETYNLAFPITAVCLDKIPKYIDGGYGAYKSVINNISFATIFDKVNTGSPDINYITIDEVRLPSGATGATSIDNNFLIEFEDYSTNVKADYITTAPIIFNGVSNSNFEPIGSKTVGLNNTYFSTMFRFNGKYNPKVNDVIYFSEDIGDAKFNDAIRKQLRFTNTNFFSTYPGFGLYKQLYINKINEQNPLTILSLNKESSLRPEFWKVGEISIDKQDSYIFRSCWDHNFHKRYESKTNFTSFPGYIEPKEVQSFLASTIMNIPNDVKIEKYGPTNVVVDVNVSNIISGQIKNTQQLIDTINPSLKPLFDKYVNEAFNFQQLGTFDDDIERYIKTNILPRYFTQNIYAYVKYSSKTSNEPVLETNKTEQELIVNGFKKLENINFIQQKFSDFDFKFTYNKPSDKNATLAFITKVTTV